MSDTPSILDTGLRLTAEAAKMIPEGHTMAVVGVTDTHGTRGAFAYKKGEHWIISGFVDKEFGQKLDYGAAVLFSI